MEKYKPARLFDCGGDIQGRWFVEYFYRDPETGKMIRFKHYISSRIRTRAGRREKAHEIIRQINLKLKQGFNPFQYKELRCTNIIRAIEYILEIKKSYCRIRTYHSYRYMAKCFTRWLIIKHYDTLSIEEFNSHQAQEFMDYQKSKNITNRTHNYQLMDIKAFFNMLVDREWIMVNPFRRVKKLPVEDPEIVCFTPEELALMQKHLPVYDYNLYVVASLIFYCFIRPAEIVRMQFKHINLDRRIITLPGHVSKNRKTETIQIPNPLVKVLTQFDMKYPQDWYIFSRKLRPGTRQIAPTRIAESWREFASLVGIKKKIYSLKHTAVGLAIEKGINTRDLQLQIRHSSLEVTQIYLDKFRRLPSEKLSRDFPSLNDFEEKKEMGTFIPISTKLLIGKNYPQN